MQTINIFMKDGKFFSATIPQPMDSSESREIALAFRDAYNSIFGVDNEVVSAEINGINYL